MNCSEVMTKNPVCCMAGDSVTRVAQLMHREDVGSLPVVQADDSKKLIGIVTDRDLALRVVGANRNPAETSVQDVMTGSPITCYADDDLNETLEMMASHQVRRIPVIDRNGDIVGIIAQADVALRVDNDQKTAEVVGEISRPTY
jgi:CBS domain-containing protein